jgi:glycosyltransferase involved in cell wall biosynthesis
MSGGLGHGLATAWRVMRAEGPRAALDRARDRLDERRERRRAVLAAPGTLGEAAVLSVVGIPLSARLGGLPIQLRNRLDWEARARPCAVLHPDGEGWRLDRLHRTDRRVLWRREAPLEDAVRWGLSETGAAVVHCEGLAGLSAETLGALARQGARLVISVHDFSFFCRRPHLVERPADRFCGYCRDLERCQACLRQDFEVEPGFQARYRDRAAALLRSAEAVVFPSRFLRDVHLDLVPGLDAARLRVIEPGTPPLADAPERRGVGPAKDTRHVAWVGAVQVHKGALVFEQVVRRLQAERVRLRWTALGGGDASLLARFRALPGVAVRGYWRTGALPAVLRDSGVDLALLLAIWPEAYGLTLDESWRAGVGVVAFDHGAMAERVRRFGGGRLVPPEEGAEGVARAIRQLLAGALPAAPGPGLLPSPAQAADAHAGLYRDLGLLAAGSA